jgi:hypothetical protein
MRSSWSRHKADTMADAEQVGMRNRVRRIWSERKVGRHPKKNNQLENWAIQSASISYNLMQAHGEG